MKLSVVLEDQMPDLPAASRATLFAAFEEIAATLSEIPLFSAIWDSLEAAPLQLDHEGWRFLYLVKRETGRLTVVYHSRFGNTPNSVWKHAKR
jgi:hypothetical protein